MATALPGLHHLHLKVSPPLLAMLTSFVQMQSRAVISVHIMRAVRVHIVIIFTLTSFSFFFFFFFFLKLIFLKPMIRTSISFFSIRFFLHHYYQLLITIIDRVCRRTAAPCSVTESFQEASKRCALCTSHTVYTHLFISIPPKKKKKNQQNRSFFLFSLFSLPSIGSSE